MKTKFLRIVMKQINRWSKCKTCDEAMESAISSYNKNEPFTLMFNPARNCSGNVTDWHICILNQESVNEILNK